MGEVLMMTNRREGGWSETGVYVDRVLHAVVSHPCAGASWFLHTMDFKSRRYSTQTAALAAATKHVQGEAQ